MVSCAAGLWFYQRAGEACDCWTETDGSMALLVQLLLSLDRRDLAQSTYNQAKRVGNDSALVQAMEAWIGLKTVHHPAAKPHIWIKLTIRAHDRCTNLTTTTKSYTNSPQAEHRLSSLRTLHRTFSSDTSTRPRRTSARRRKGKEGTRTQMCLLSARRYGWTAMRGESRVTRWTRLAYHYSKLQSAAPSHPFALDLAQKSKAFDDAAAQFGITA